MTNRDNLDLAGAADAAVAAEYAIAATEPHPIGDVPAVLVVPAGGTHHIIDPERLGLTPRRPRGTVTAATPDGLAAVVNRYKSQAAVLYADARSGRITAVLNDHVGDIAGWGDHRVDLALRHTPEWTTWMRLNDTPLEQTDFAEHVEANVDDVVEPSGADMLELAQTFQASSSVRFVSNQRLQNGQTQFTYHEDVDAKAGKDGTITIPDRFVIGVAPWEGCPKYRANCRLRFRVRNQRLTLTYLIDRPERILLDAFTTLLDTVREQVGEDVLIVEGTAPDPIRPA